MLTRSIPRTWFRMISCLLLENALGRVPLPLGTFCVSVVLATHKFLSAYIEAQTYSAMSKAQIPVVFVSAGAPTPPQPSVI